MKREDAMCGGHACPLKEKCQHYLRYLESGGIGYWVVAMFKDDKCEEFQQVKDESTKERQTIVEESYVSLDTAKILKEVGFKEPCRIHCTNSGGTWEGAIPTTMDDVGKFVFFPCPTHALVARWLREKHAIHVLITPLLDGWMIDLFDLTKHQYLLCNKDAVADTYEEAFEEGIQEAIKLIKK